MQPSEHYRAQRQRISELVQGLSAEQLQTRVPGCPAWTVRELLSHLTGITADLAAGRFEGAGTEAWTAPQVADRQGKGVDELLAEWAEFAPGVEDVMDELGTAGHRLYFDVTMHEDDLREALDLPPASGATQTAVLDGLVALAGSRLGKAGVPALALRASDRSWTAGEGEPAATVTAPSEGELSRALSGRRSLDQMRAMDWQGDPEPYLPLLPLFPPG